jgi:hypothetical protein
MLILIAANDLILILVNYFRKLQLPISEVHRTKSTDMAVATE